VPRYPCPYPSLALSRSRTATGPGTRTLTSTRASAGTGSVLERCKFGLAEPAGVEGANRLEHILDGDVFPLPPARRNRAAVQDKTGDIEPGERHGGTGNRLVTPDQNHQRVEVIRARDQLDRISDDLAAHQGHPHTLGAHGDAVRHRHSVELHGRGPCRAHPFLHRRGEPAQVEIAGADLDPRVSDPDKRFAEVGVGESNGLEHRASWRAVAAAGDGQAAAWTRSRGSRRGHTSTLRLAV
jgi:hypothetical protein